ncbi:MAG: tRNA (adenosine(37)-N6)-threonylcarbamoyltransferase complex dimerization subunit type 1 TsaB [Desulforegulaceae bacterium]|nr:tRNA (adenosine(37)-N6)-threonylcarbamoyltransferase complex dimerization subunit type 1 TsaB [Desulforegulaceae bacterium]
MLVFSADTAAEYLNLALFEDDRVLSEISFKNRGTHSRNIISNINYCYKLAKKELAETDLFAVCKGPGNFTGVRIGVSTLKGISFSLKKPLIGVSSLDASAYLFRYSDKKVLSVIDARRKEVYYSFYRFENGKLCEKTPESVGKPELIKDDGCGEIILTGNGALMYKDFFDLSFKKVYCPPAWMREAKSGVICEIAKEKFEKNFSDDKFGVLPNYIRRSNAEESFEQKS